MKRKRHFCQSCGMPMDHDPLGGGINADGSLNEEYCSFCYQNGKFTKECSAAEFQEYCRKILRENGHSRFISWFFTRGIKYLSRCKKK